MFYALTQDEPKIMSKVNLFVALAPIVRPSHSFFSGIQTIVKHLEELAIATNLLGIYSVMGPKMKTTVQNLAASKMGQYYGIFETMVG